MINFFFNFMYRPFTLSFDCNIFDSREIGIDNKVSACINKVVSKLQFSTQSIQAQPNQSYTQQFYPPIQLT